MGAGETLLRAGFQQKYRRNGNTGPRHRLLDPRRSSSGRDDTARTPAARAVRHWRSARLSITFYRTSVPNRCIIFLTSQPPNRILQ